MIDASEIVFSREDPTVGHLRVLSAHLEDKPPAANGRGQAAAIAAIAASKVEQGDDTRWTFDYVCAEVDNTGSDIRVDVPPGSTAISAVAPATRTDTVASLPPLSFPAHTSAVDGIFGVAGLCVETDNAGQAGEAATAAVAAGAGDAAAVPLRSVGDEAREVIGKLVELLTANGLTAACVIQVSCVFSPFVLAAPSNYYC